MAASEIFPPFDLQDALAQSAVRGSFIDTAYHIFSHRLLSGKVGKPRVIYGNSLVMKAAGQHFRGRGFHANWQHVSGANYAFPQNCQHLSPRRMRPQRKSRLMNTGINPTVIWTTIGILRRSDPLHRLQAAVTRERYTPNHDSAQMFLHLYLFSQSKSEDSDELSKKAEPPKANEAVEHTVVITDVAANTFV